jgi:hypothetical protein
MKELWILLNNKKTSIGAGLLFLAFVLEKMSEIWLDGAAPGWLPKSIETLEWVGCVFSGVGLSHKGVKAMEEK